MEDGRWKMEDGRWKMEDERWEEMDILLFWTWTDANMHSYESLPPNFSLAANMAAGAFAGIAVCLC
jgi:hypothetical protein